MNRTLAKFKRENFRNSLPGNVDAQISGEPNFSATFIMRYLYEDKDGNKSEEIVARDANRELVFVFQRDIRAGTYRLLPLIDGPIPSGKIYSYFKSSGALLYPVPEGNPNSITFDSGGGRPTIGGTFTFTISSSPGDSPKAISGEFGIVGFSK
ncbi:hypothetical protein E3Z27_26185 [Pseudomonas mediterranea]|jgi:hypothetical protein|uniref:Uncharacterized protein n=1 Tax=Pseudomonas mediterranea TaxID=183795 RepID=A0AAX2D7L9_9PSED|nr:hypothetical protein [Pseudomonas mediterranea]MBL0842507.1 hypothetical protein [Pseudomonas mediterranea]MDU9029096.1 hypothetical protein [Pseudomonas mediterranea]QHA84891.1 hypothetical protein E3Z27_26185 [Pseudomonas mediterranea]UZE00622.1 hypothetical protein LOY71_24515 [Pseudomonas mediterranea]CAH0146988.1 hypothetical protein SRABI112_00589 [Pseudomonas mediterranea]